MCRKATIYTHINTQACVQKLHITTETITAVIVLDIMSISIEALATAGVDYNEWGMDFEEWERMQTGPPPPHLYADDYDQDHEYERDKEVIMMMATDATEELLGSTKPKNQLIDVFDERNKESGDDFLMQLPKTNIKTMNRGHGIKRLKMLMVAMMVIRFLRTQIL
ncbi:hypothetical protein L1987_33855 [Smallanthus sonchifolius]|uniref:Uncharacterized protein n=3 Tax=Smallanthus sonchifolius TaxID=185202 RepID=A0ACB9HRH6_9ASTR|nr:hypothetical protein L1987_33849 [Smallanthus sonchifolius]KAI3798575.1 hypothetical protein L1987_33852 [Smallanthus sonchifolius]KAI3798578.1 hypothetical protein L1987_33855 [Smallanthus sonchifolius]